MAYITFIIPTLGRYSIHNTIGSLHGQSDSDWKAIAVFDNHDVTINTDDKLSAFRFDKPPGNGPGIVRNEALPLVDTEWTGFVDDDDYLDKDYIRRLKLFGKDNDLVVFSYKDMQNGNTQPPLHFRTIVYCNVGISFAVRTRFIQDNNIKFSKGSCEDYSFIMECVNAGAKPIVTGEIRYYVGSRSGWR